jgi:hypothetical protein
MKTWGIGVVDPRILSLDNEWRSVVTFTVGCLTTSINWLWGWMESRASLNLSGKWKVSHSFPVIKQGFLLFQPVIHTLYGMCYPGSCIPSAIRFSFLVKVCFFCSQNDYDKNKFAEWNAGKHINGRQANLGRGLQSGNRQIAFSILHIDTSCCLLFFIIC